MTILTDVSSSTHADELDYCLIQAQNQLEHTSAELTGDTDISTQLDNVLYGLVEAEKHLMIEMYQLGSGMDELEYYLKQAEDNLERVAGKFTGNSHISTQLDDLLYTLTQAEKHLGEIRS